MSIMTLMSINEYYYNPTGLHPSPFHAVLHLPSRCRQAKKGYLWACLQVLPVVLAIQDSCGTAVVL